MNCFRSKVIVFAVLLSMVIVSCGQKNENDIVKDGSSLISDEYAETVDDTVNEEAFPAEYSDFKLESIDGGNKAHKKYLNDELLFKPIPIQPVNAEHTAVVGVRDCKFYPDVELSKQEDVNSLPDGIDVPFGTILPIDMDYMHLSEDHADEHDLFSFLDNLNYFYRTEWQGKKGVVFGANLKGLELDNRRNRIISLKYLTNSVYPDFYPLLGYKRISATKQKVLERDRLIFQDVNSSEYELDEWRPDDMITLSGGPLGASVFITTDLISHVKHLMFDRMLQHAEQFYFLPKLQVLVDSFLKELMSFAEENNLKTDSKIAKYETLQKTIEYFKVAEALIKLAPEEVEPEEYGNHYLENYGTVDFEKIISEYSTTVQNELKLIYNADEFLVNSPLFTFKDGSTNKEDYTQYKPRGHYIKNDVIKAYFRAMMWFGRSHFIISKGGSQSLEKDGTTSSDVDSLTYNMEPIALLITELVNRNPNLYTQWEELFTPITELIGVSDDLSFREILPLWQSYNVTNFRKWTSDRANLLQLMEYAHNNLRSPAIAGNSVLYAAAEGNSIAERKPPIGWRLFGQRYVYDGVIFNNISAPKLADRGMVSCLDIMKVFGSRYADYLLTDEYDQYPQLKPILDGIEKEIASNSEILGNTYYGHVLNEVAAQASFEQGTGFYFTESPAWNKKALLSAHGTFAELKHDTILYSKNDLAENGGGGWYAPTFRTEDVPEPIPYIEPNLKFWKSVETSSRLLADIFKKYKLLHEYGLSKIDSLVKLCSRAVKIVELEIQDKPISEDDINFINDIPFRLSRLIFIAVPYGKMNPEDLQMALIANIFSNSESGLALETGVGIPYRIYVPLNDGQGGKRIAIGCCFNYYEFTQPVTNVLTDKEWKKMVYDSENPVPESYKPDWAQNISMPAYKNE